MSQFDPPYVKLLTPAQYRYLYNGVLDNIMRGIFKTDLTGSCPNQCRFYFSYRLSKAITELYFCPNLGGLTYSLIIDSGRICSMPARWYESDGRTKYRCLMGEIRHALSLLKEAQ